MGIQVSSLQELNADLVREAQRVQAQILQEWHPRLSVIRGVIHDLVLYPQGIVLAALRLEADRLRRSSSLLTALEDPQLADPEIIDGLAANFLLSRQGGSRARGRILITISRRVPLTVGQGFRFIGQGMTFLVPFTSMVRPSAEAVEGPHDKVLTPTGNGHYTFQIEVLAESEGSAYNLRRGAFFTCVPDLPYFVSAQAVEDFYGGRDPESNADLLQRIQLGPTAKTAGSRTQMVAAISSRPEFSGLVSHSLIGYGDLEMRRDQHTLWPGSTGGKIDWYIRPTEQPVAKILKKTAELLWTDLDLRGIWRINLTRDDYPGFYFVERIVAQEDDPDPLACEILDETLGYDLSPLEGIDVLPDIQSSLEAAFTRFQTLTLTFRDPRTSTQGLIPSISTRDYFVRVLGFPLIAELQRFASQRDFRPPTGDILVRAPVPCFVSVAVRLYRYPSGPAPDLAQAARICAARINRLGFRGRLTTAWLAEALQELFGPNTEIMEIVLHGSLRRPDGAWQYFHSNQALEIPVEEDGLVSPRNTVFITTEKDIAFDVQLRSAETF